MENDLQDKDEEIKQLLKYKQMYFKQLRGIEDAKKVNKDLTCLNMDLQRTVINNHAQILGT